MKNPERVFLLLNELSYRRFCMRNLVWNCKQWKAEHPEETAAAALLSQIIDCTEEEEEVSNRMAAGDL